MNEAKPSETKPKKMVRRSVAITLGIVCIVLVVVGSVGAIAYIIPMINDKNNTISSLNSQVSQLNSSNTNLQNQVSSLNSTIDSLSSNNTNLQNQVSSLNSTINYLKTGFRVIDPSYQEMLTFVGNESVFGNGKSENSIFNATSDFVNDALNAGYRCGIVLIDFTQATYSVACFNTTDHGLIFVDAGLNMIVRLVIGQHYYVTNNLATSTIDDTVLSYTIIW